jgi:hypothetical protein
MVLLPNLIWGFSTGAINSVLFLRMYILVTIFYLLLLYVVFNIIHRKNAGLKDYLLLGFTVYCGILSHYHFILWAFLVLSVYFAVIYSRRMISVIFKSFIAIASSAVLSCISFPVISNSLNSPHKKWLFKNIFSFEKIQDIGKFFNFYTEEYFLLEKNIVLAAILLCFISIIVKKIFFNKDSVGKKCFSFRLSTLSDKHLFVLFTALSFIFITVVAYTSRLKTERYIWPVGPMGIIVLLFSIKYILDNYFNFSDLLKRVILILIAFTFVVSGFFADRTLLLLYKYDKSVSIAGEYASLSAVCVSNTNSGESFNDIGYVLMRFKSVIFTDFEKGESLSEILNALQKEKEFVVVFSRITERTKKGYNDNALRFIESFGWKAEKLFEKSGSTAYLVQHENI